MIDLTEIAELYPFRFNYLEIEGQKYHYIDEGSGDPIVMVHGNPTWSFYYRNLIKHFSKTHRVIVPDHMGCGLSDKPQDYNYTLKNHVLNLELLLNQLELKNVTLVVHDWGGAIGMGAATHNPKRIKRIVILNSGAYSMKFIPFRIALCKLPWFGEYIVRRFNAFAYPATFMTTTKPLDDKVKKGYLLPYNNYANRIAVSRFVEDIPLSPEHQSYEYLLEIEHGLWMFRETPICIIWGMKDWCFNERFLDRWMTYYPQAEIHRIDTAGHYVLEDACDEAIKHIELFFCKHK